MMVWKGGGQHQRTPKPADTALQTSLIQLQIFVIMLLSLDEYRCKLINKLLFAGSQEEVRRFCDAAMKSLEHHKVNGHLVARFVEKMIGELNQFNPMDKDAQ